MYNIVHVLCIHRLHNKGVYLQLGVQKTFSRDTTAELHQIISLKVRMSVCNVHQ